MDDDFKMPWGKVIGWTFGIIVLLFVVGVGMNLLGMGFQFVWLPFYKFQSRLNQTQGTIDIVNDPQRCINIDAQFQTLTATVPALRDQQIPNAKQALTDFEARLPVDETKWSFTQQQEDGELQTNVTGLEQQLSQLQAQYTAFMARPDVVPCAGQLPLFINLK